MSKVYTNGEEQNSERVANFAEAAKGMGLGLAIYATTDKSFKMFAKAQQKRTYTEVDTAWGGREGEVAASLNKYDLGGVSFGMAAVVLAYTGRKEIKNAFVYGVKGLHTASKKMLSFAKTAIEEMQEYTQQHIAEDRENPDRNTFFNNLNKFMHRGR